MAHLNSNNIKIFPFGSDRRIYDPFGRVLNEQNIVKLIKSLVDNDSYVISYDANTKACTFVIGGYYCECVLTDFIDSVDSPDLPDLSDNSTDKTLVASIRLQEEYTEVEVKQSDDSTMTISGTYKQLYGNDFKNEENNGESRFTAIHFGPTAVANASAKLVILNANGDVPEDSWKKFNNTSVGNNYKWIDCGTAVQHGAIPQEIPQE